MEYLENLKVSIKKKVSYLERKLSIDLAEDIRLLYKVRKETYEAILSEIDYLLSLPDLSLSSIPKKIELEDNIDIPPYFYIFTILGIDEKKEFCVESDFLVTQTNISKVNSRLRNIRNEKYEYGVVRVNDPIDLIDYKLEGEVIISLTKGDLYD